MTRNLFLLDMGEESENYLDKAGINNTCSPLEALSCVDLPCHPPSPPQANLALPLSDSLLRSHLLASALWLVIGRFGRWWFVHSVKVQVERENRRDCPFFGAESATI